MLLAAMNGEHTKGENTLNISVAENCSTHSVNFRSAAHGIYMNIPSGSSYNKNTMNYVYFEFDSGNVQDLMFSNYVDPQFFTMNVSIEFGNLKISKSSEDEIIKSSNWCKTRLNRVQTITDYFQTCLPLFCRTEKTI